MKRVGARGLKRNTWGYTVAHVSIDNYEWKYGELYGKALEAGDGARAREVVDAWIPHMRDAVRHYQEVAVRKVGRDVAHVLLLHANRLNADHLGDLLTALEADGARFIPLSEALADPVYSLPNAYDGKWGISWLYRIAPVDRETPWDDGEYEKIRRRFLGG